MRKALVTGATGFVAANLARRLLRDGHEVHLLVRGNHSTWRVEEIRRYVRLHEVNFADADSMRSALRRIKPDWIFHLAAHGGYSSQRDVQEMIATNILGTVNLVEAAVEVGFETFVNTGSSSEYGFKDHAPHEQEWLDPNSHYAVTKAAATHFCRYTAVKRNVNICTLRLYSVYGPFEEPTRLLPTIIINGLRGRLPPLVQPTIARDYVYIDDVNDAYLSVASSASNELGAVYNVGTGVQTSLAEVVDVARTLLGISAEPHWGSMSDRTWDTNIWLAQNRRIREVLNWAPRYRFAEGLQAMVEWFRADPQRIAFYEARGAKT